MIYIILNSYKKFKKENKKSLKNWIRDLKKSHKIFLTLFILLGIFSISMILCWLKSQKSKYLVASELGVVFLLLCDFILIVNMNKNEIETSNDALIRTYKYYDEVLEWLKMIEYSKKNQIKQLCRQCENIIEKKELEKEKAKKYIDKIFIVFIAPALLVIISWILEGEGWAEECLIFVIALIVIGCIVYIMIMRIINEFLDFIYSDKKDLQQMANDLQGVLDRCFEIEENDIVK